MGYPRKSLICLADTPYYHVVARCVRRAFLWGYDAYAGKDYSHRKAWVLHRLRYLSEIFSIDLCAYAIMSNHYHLVLRVDRQRMARWSAIEVVARWTQLFSAPPLIERWQEGRASAAERMIAEELIERWRLRLIDISWYMRCLNEYLARRANAEDECTGRFWQGRFSSQALLDEAGLLTAMAYVDLNPVRAGIAKTPEESEFTSLYARLQRHQHELAAQVQARPTPRSRVGRQAPPLLGFSDAADPDRPSIPMTFLDYLQLLDWSGRERRADKHGAIGQALPPILARLQIDPDAWLCTMRPGGRLFGRAIGRVESMRAHARRLGQSWIRGLQAARKLQQA
ncbi:transposase [Peristeroidobacter agariperforans]|uniref:transposase n=1 Tax=Peristeroidobacter agariperforans TaxID=268404 RepID=UPI00101DA711|nr:transposase [Peristeroidobacter agariperforans]